MAEYQQIEYCIGQDGKITEKILGGVSGAECIAITEALETSLGYVAGRELLPEDDHSNSSLTPETETQSLLQS